MALAARPVADAGGHFGGAAYDVARFGGSGVGGSGDGAGSVCNPVKQGADVWWCGRKLGCKVQEIGQGSTAGG